eukprot:1195424-Prorocentrum_minimum.AAC.16
MKGFGARGLGCGTGVNKVEGASLSAEFSTSVGSVLHLVSPKLNPGHGVQDVQHYATVAGPPRADGGPTAELPKLYLLSKLQPVSNHASIHTAGPVRALRGNRLRHAWRGRLSNAAHPAVCFNPTRCGSIHDK